MEVTGIYSVEHMKLTNGMRGIMQSFVLTPGGEARQAMKEYSNSGGTGATHSYLGSEAEVVRFKLNAP